MSIFSALVKFWALLGHDGGQGAADLSLDVGGQWGARDNPGRRSAAAARPAHSLPAQARAGRCPTPPGVPAVRPVCGRPRARCIAVLKRGASPAGALPRPHAPQAPCQLAHPPAVVARSARDNPVAARTVVAELHAPHTPCPARHKRVRGVGTPACLLVVAARTVVADPPAGRSAALHRAEAVVVRSKNKKKIAIRHGQLCFEHDRGAGQARRSAEPRTAGMVRARSSD